MFAVTTTAFHTFSTSLHRGNNWLGVSVLNIRPHAILHSTQEKEVSKYVKRGYDRWAFLFEIRAKP